MENVNLSRDEKTEIICNFIEPVIREDKYFSNYQRLLRVFRNLIHLEYFENKFFQYITLRLIFSKRFKKLEHIFFVMLELEEVSKLDIYQNRYNFEKEIEICKKLMGEKREFLYRFDLKNKKHYTYSEMYAKRENYNTEQKESTVFNDSPENLQKIYDFKENVLDDPKLFKFDYSDFYKYKAIPPREGQGAEDELGNDYISSEDIEDEEGKDNYELPDEIN